MLTNQGNKTSDEWRKLSGYPFSLLFTFVLLHIREAEAPESTHLNRFDLSSLSKFNCVIGAAIQNVCNIFRPEKVSVGSHALVPPRCSYHKQSSSRGSGWKKRFAWFDREDIAEVPFKTRMPTSIRAII
jgi:hypothetical protein